MGAFFLRQSIKMMYTKNAKQHPASASYCTMMYQSPNTITIFCKRREHCLFTQCAGFLGGNAFYSAPMSFNRLCNNL